MDATTEQELMTTMRLSAEALRAVTAALVDLQGEVEELSDRLSALESRQLQGA